jgi:pyruvate decarboxylase
MSSADNVQQCSVGSYLGHRLVDAGVSHFFTVPGDFTLALLDELLANPKLKMVGCCNELNAGISLFLSLLLTPTTD